MELFILQKIKNNLAKVIDKCDIYKKVEIDIYGKKAKEIINKYYKWSKIIKDYENLFLGGY